MAKGISKPKPLWKEEGRRDHAKAQQAERVMYGSDDGVIPAYGRKGPILDVASTAGRRTKIQNQYYRDKAKQDKADGTTELMNRRNQENL